MSTGNRNSAPPRPIKPPRVPMMPPVEKAKELIDAAFMERATIAEWSATVRTEWMRRPRILQKMILPFGITYVCRDIYCI
ncbi:hypothetical protein [Xanthobacter sp.]|uniref:hypothetical protein n=1 Tax=Xanthobacter sp. TaxID=35809 RepID=UPI0025E3C71A|nr:hypothetical protein [Xanthobacter sp.]